jgi:hypothetical protein
MKHARELLQRRQSLKEKTPSQVILDSLPLPIHI